MNKHIERAYWVGRVEAQDILSGIISQFPAVEERLMKSEAPSHVVSRWYSARHTPVDLVPWATSNPAAESGTLAADYKKSAKIGVSRAVIEAATVDMNERQLAVGFAMGSVAMVAVVPEGLEFGYDTKYPDELQFGMGIGKHGDLRGALGMWSLADRTFIIPAGAEPVTHETYATRDFPVDVPHF